MKYYVITAINPLTHVRDFVSVPMQKAMAKKMIQDVRKRNPGIYRMHRLQEYEPNQLTFNYEK